MAEFDPQQVVDLVQSGSEPDEWVTFRASRGPLIGRALQGAVYAIVCAPCSALCLYISLYAIYQASHLLPEVDLILASIFAPLFGALVFGVSSWRFARMAWESLQLLAAYRAVWIAVTPDGVVEYRGARLRIGHSFAFADTINITRTTTYSTRFLRRFALTFWRAHPSQPKRRLATVWFVNLCFQPLDQLADRIIFAGYNARSQARRSPFGMRRSLEPEDARPHMVWNAAGWSCAMLFNGVVVALVAIGMFSWILITGSQSGSQDFPWIALESLAGFLALIAVVCLLIAWGKNDWKRPVKR